MIHLNVQASDPSQLEGMWDWLRGSQADVDIVNGEMHITVDLGTPGAMALVEPLPAETVAVAEPEVTYTLPQPDDIEVVEPTPQVEVRDLDLRSEVLACLAESKQTASSIASRLHIDVADAKAVLSGLKEEGLVRLAGVAGWALTDPPEAPSDEIKRTRVDHDAARRRAAGAM